MRDKLPQFREIRTGFQATIAGDDSYFLNHSLLNHNNWFIRNVNTGIIVWNGYFKTASEAIEAAEMDGFEFSK